MSISKHPNKIVHFTLVALICLAGISTGVWVNLRILETLYNKDAPPAVHFTLESPVEEADRFSVTFTFENNLASLPQDFFFFDLYIDDEQVAEFSPPDRLPPKQDMTGTFFVPKEKLPSGEHVLTFLARYNPARSLPYPMPVHHVVSMKVDIPESEVGHE